MSVIIILVSELSVNFSVNTVNFSRFVMSVPVSAAALCRINLNTHANDSFASIHCNVTSQHYAWGNWCEHYFPMLVCRCLLYAHTKPVFVGYNRCLFVPVT